MEQNNNGKELAKLGAKAILNAATAPLKALIMTAIGTILPYILIGAVIFVVILCVYFGTLEQIDEILDGSTNWGERMGNAISLYGFKTNQELEEDEEGKFFEMLSLYQKLFGFSNRELSIMNQTLLYEGSNEERIYLSESPEDYNDKNADNSKISIDILDSEGNVSSSSTFWSFLKNIVTNYQRGFFSTYGGQSQYLKANKNMLVNAAALKKCSLLTSQDSTEEEQCYKGYLIAEYNLVTDFFIDCDKSLLQLCDSEKVIETDVEPGFLVLPNNIFGETVGVIGELIELQDTISNFFQNFTIFGGLWQKFEDFVDTSYDAVTLFVLGTLADEDTLHFYYDGYIVNNLKETYKVFKNSGYDDEDTFGDFYSVLPFYDKEIVEKERKNRRKTANDIMNMVDSYFELTYGHSTLKESEKFLPSQGSSSFAYGTSCLPISESDLAYFGSPTNSCNLTSCFGVYGGGWACSSHKGVDVNAPNGIYSVCDGTVTMRGMYQDGSASAVEVQCNINGNLYTVRYLHMPMSSVNKWNVGDKVPIGTYIGEQGAVGYGVSGAHLHLDVSVNGSYVNPEALVSNCSFNINCESARNSCERQGLYYCK